MAIFKCPECGHMVSNKAPRCPGCGIEITTDMLNVQTVSQETEPVSVLPMVESIPINESTKSNEKPQQQHSEKKKGCIRPILYISVLIAALICGGMYYTYQKAAADNERNDYQIAMKSENLLTLQSYIDTYRNSAPTTHLDNVRSRMERLRSIGEEWNNTLIANSRSMYEEYLQAHPDTPHKAFILNKIDSLDWEHAKNLDSEKGYDDYMEKHPSGHYITNAEHSIKKLRLTLISPEEKENAQTVIKHFFQAINARNKSALLNNSASVMSSLLGESGAGPDKIVEFMNKMYKEDVTNLNWYLDPINAIEKEDIGSNEYQYKIQLPARLRVARGQVVTETRYRINAIISPDSKVSALSLTKLAE